MEESLPHGNVQAGNHQKEVEFEQVEAGDKQVEVGNIWEEVGYIGLDIAEGTAPDIVEGTVQDTVGDIREAA